MNCKYRKSSKALNKRARKLNKHIKKYNRYVLEVHNSPRDMVKELW